MQTFKNPSVLTSPVVSLSFAMGFLSNPALLGIVHNFLPSLAALGRRREELCEGVDQTLGLAVKAQAALGQVVVVPL